MSEQPIITAPVCGLSSALQWSRRTSLMQRSSDGARYWRSTDAQPQAPRQLSDEEAYARYWGAEEE